MKKYIIAIATLSGLYGFAVVYLFDPMHPDQHAFLTQWMSRVSAPADTLTDYIPLSIALNKEQLIRDYKENLFLASHIFFVNFVIFIVFTTITARRSILFSPYANLIEGDWLNNLDKIQRKFEVDGTTFVFLLCCIYIYLISIFGGKDSFFADLLFNRVEENKYFVLVDCAYMIIFYSSLFSFLGMVIHIRRAKDSGRVVRFRNKTRE